MQVHDTISMLDGHFYLVERLHPRRSKQCDQIWQNFATWQYFSQDLVNFARVCVVFGKMLNLLWQLFYNIGSIFTVVNG